jgi:hypothetical protein
LRATDGDRAPIIRESSSVDVTEPSQRAGNRKGKLELHARSADDEHLPERADLRRGPEDRARDQHHRRDALDER